MLSFFCFKNLTLRDKKTLTVKTNTGRKSQGKQIEMCSSESKNKTEKKIGIILKGKN